MRKVADEKKPTKTQTEAERAANGYVRLSVRMRGDAVQYLESKRREGESLQDTIRRRALRGMGVS